MLAAGSAIASWPSVYRNEVSPPTGGTFAINARYAPPLLDLLGAGRDTGWIFAAAPGADVAAVRIGRWVQHRPDAWWRAAAGAALIALGVSCLIRLRVVETP